MQITREIVTQLQYNKSVVLATIIRRTGSAPRQAGARMLITQDAIIGTIGGGLPEAEAIAKAMRVQQVEIIHFDMTPFTADADLICGGEIDILLEKILPQQLNLFKQALNFLETSQSGAWLIDYTNLKQFKRELYQDPPPNLPIKRHLATSLVHEEHELYYEPLVQQSSLVLCGGGHVSVHTALLASQVGFKVTVIDDRTEYANVHRFPWASATHVLPDFIDITKHCPIGPEHYVIIVTRGHAHDRACLSQIIPTKAKYIGMIGSKKKRDTTYNRLLNEGFKIEDLAKVKCPIGLDIGAETPEEIAIAIVAELIACRAGRD